MNAFKQAARPILVFAVLLTLWEVSLLASNFPEYVLPRPTVILARLWATRAEQLYHLGATASTTVAGLSLALVVGVLMALAVVYLHWLKALIMPVLAAFNSIPKIAVAPLLVIWFGLGAETKVVLAFLLSVFPIFVNSITGLGEIEADVLDLSKLSGGTPWRIFLKVRLINAVPYITDALRIAFPLALVGSIVGEFIAGNLGAGYLVLSGQFNLDTPLVFAALLCITLFATLGIGVIGMFDSYFVTWKHSTRRR